MKRSMILEIIKKELRDIIRDKKTLIMMIIIPILLFPLMIGFLITLEESMLNVEESKYNSIGFAFEIDDTLNEIIKEGKIQKITGSKEELRTKLNNLEIDSYVTLENNKFIIYYTENSTYGKQSLALANSILETYKQAIQAEILINGGIMPEEIFNIYTVETKDISNRDNNTDLIIGIVPSFILMTTTLTAVFAAIDMTAGEKERGTLETLLTFPLKNSDIIYGKFFATTICTVISSLLGFTALYGVSYYFSKTLDNFKGLEMLSAQNILLLIIIFVLYSMLISAISIVIASKAKSFKEAQNSTQPLAFISIVPMFMSMMGTKLDTTLSLVPFLNVSLMITDIMSNTVNIHYYILMVFSNLIFITLILKSIIKLYKSDKILFS